MISLQMPSKLNALGALVSVTLLLNACNSQSVDIVALEATGHALGGAWANWSQHQVDQITIISRNAEDANSSHALLLELFDLATDVRFVDNRCGLLVAYGTSSLPHAAALVRQLGIEINSAPDQGDVSVQLAEILGAAVLPISLEQLPLSPLLYGLGNGDPKWGLLVPTNEVARQTFIDITRRAMIANKEGLMMRVIVKAFMPRIYSSFKRRALANSLSAALMRNH